MPEAKTKQGGGGRAKNVIFMVSDGMSLGTLVLAERYKSLVTGKGTNWLSTYSRPGLHRALMDTASANSLVTDSSAASSAWGCGRRINNGAINVAPDGTPLKPIFHFAREAGVACGLVTTATVTHATPAGFVAQVSARATEKEIALQYLAAGMDVVLGGGTKFFDAAKREDKRDLCAEFSGKGYRVVRNKNSLLSAPLDKPLLGLFSEGHMPYELDRTAEPGLTEAVPSLAEMTRRALARLASAPDGFLLQVEGARVDGGAHANDIGALLFDQLAFDEAIGVVLEFVAGRDDTLVIMTSDHGNANPGLNGVGGSFESRFGAYGATGACFEKLSHFKRTNVWVMDELNQTSTPAQIRERVKAATDLVLDDEEVDILRLALRKQHREAYRVREPALITLGQLLSNHVSIGWTGVAHTSDFTELAAFGPGCESIAGVVPNTALFGVMRGALNI
jgi:alkaline phosphatase